MGEPAEKSEDDRTQGVLNKAFGPAAEEFGREITPLGREAGAVAALAGQRFLLVVRGAVHSFDLISEWLKNALEKRLAAISAERLEEPNPRIAIPAVQSLIFSHNDKTISDMFADLLASDMNADKKGQVHPAFVEIINQMTALDARVLKHMMGGAEALFHLRLGNHGKWHPIVSEPSFSCDSAPPYELLKSLNNLVRLGLLEVQPLYAPINLRNPDAESQFRVRCARLEALHKSIPIELSKADPNPEAFVVREGIYLTPFGGAFAGACLNSI